VRRVVYDVGWVIKGRKGEGKIVVRDPVGKA